MTIGHTEERMMALAQSALAATNDGRVNWTSVDDTATAFKADQIAGSVLIESVDRDGVFPYSLSVFDSGGRKVESLKTGWYVSETDFEDDREAFEWNDLFKALYEAARGHALNIDTVINSLINDFDIPF
jgi:hypothetical protein